MFFFSFDSFCISVEETEKKAGENEKLQGNQATILLPFEH